MEMFSNARPAIGNAAFAAGIQGVLKNLPDFATFDAAVEAPQQQYATVVVAVPNVITTQAFSEQTDAEEEPSAQDDDGHTAGDLRNYVSMPPTWPTAANTLVVGDTGDYSDDEEYEAAMRKEQRPPPSSEK